MCGIAGLIGSDSNNQMPERVRKMQALLLHRGPDDCGEYFSSDHRIGLAHTRLAIQDLSPAGHQPMVSLDGRYVIVFNGEIYNFRCLRAELEADGFRFRSHSDTEVVLALYARRGPGFVRRLEGMFAFAIWDTHEHSLFLARDPLGIKPLYVWQHGDRLAFASEIRSLLSSELASRELHAPALFQYFLLGAVPEPLTLIRGMSVLPAGHYAVWQDGLLAQTQYWSLDFTNTLSDPEEAIRQTHAALNESLDRHFVSDVPVGLFLSGGLDSTALAAMAHASGRSNLQTLCISFDDAEYNEGNLAERTSGHFGCRHTDWRMTAEEGGLLAEQYLAAMDRPSSDGFNTYCVSKLARDSGLKVVLSGLGGDELFGGYPSFQMIPRFLQLQKNLGRVGLLGPVRYGLRVCSKSSKLQRLENFLGTTARVGDAWTAMRGHFTHSEAARLVRWFSGADSHASDVLSDDTDWESQQPDPAWSVADQVSWLEITNYMRNQLLRDSDVMSMAWGLELRVPFVDRKLIDRVTRIDPRIRLARGKQLLINAVPEIPEWIRRQPKRGFRFPFDAWARHSWGGWFRAVDETSPVVCRSWYRKWSLVVLHHFLKQNRITVNGKCLNVLDR